MGIKLSAGRKEEELAVSYTLPSPLEEVAFCHEVIFYCSSGGLTGTRFWQSNAVRFDIGSAIAMLEDMQTLHDKECISQTHHIDYEVTVVKAEAS